MTMFHICLDIEGTLRLKDKQIEGIIGEPDRAYSAKEVREFLIDQKAQGYSNFCGCDNRREDGGCAGHEEGQTDE